MAKKTVNRTKYQLEDNVKRVLFLNRGQENSDPFAIPYATRAEADAGIALDRVMNPDVSAYAYDRLRHSAQHSAGKGTSVAVLQPVSGVVPVDCRRSNVFGLAFTENLLLGNPVNNFNGQVINFIFQQDDVGGRTITFGDAYAFIGGDTPQLSTAAGAIDLMSCQYYPTAGVWLCSWLSDFTGTGTGSGGGGGGGGESTSFSMESVGAGAEVYKGTVDLLGVATSQLRSITGSNGITVTENTDEIDMKMTRTIFVQSATPTANAVGDLWFW